MLRRHEALAFSGSVHFITTVTAVRGNWLTDPALCSSILTIFEGYRAKHNLDCIGYVLMPDHLHAVIAQNEDGGQVQAFMRSFKRLTSERCRPEEYGSPHLWRRRYDDVPLPGMNAVKIRLEYMHYNPVRRRLVGEAVDYPWSSAHLYMDSRKDGLITINYSLVAG